MTELISLVATPLVALALCAIFVLVLVVVRKTITEMSFFSTTSGWIVAVCVATLSVVGLLRFFGSSGHATHIADEPEGHGGVLDVILAPYVALVLLLLLLLVLWMVWPCVRRRHPAKDGTSMGIEDERDKSMVAEDKLRVEETKNSQTKIKPGGRPAKAQITNRSIRTRGRMLEKNGNPSGGPRPNDTERDSK